MTRRLEAGEAGEPTIYAQAKVEGRWAEVKARNAQRWYGRVYYRNTDGVRKEIERTARTRGRVETAIQDALQQALRGDLRDSGDTPLVRLGQAWVDDLQRADSGYAANSVERYSIAWNVYLKEEPLLRLPIKIANDPSRLRDLLRKIADTRGTATTQVCRAVLSGVLQRAIDDRLITTNALRSVRKVSAAVPKDNPHDHARAFTREERDAVLAKAYEMYEATEYQNGRTRRKARVSADLLSFMAGTAARVAEARAVEWATYDGTRVHVPGTKSETAPRWVNPPAWLVQRLEERRRDVGSEGLMFGAPNGGPADPWDGSNCSGALRRVLDAAGFPWAVPHTLRRTVASLLDDSGVPVRRIADQLGIDPDTVVKYYLGRDLSGDKADLAELL